MSFESFSTAVLSGFLTGFKAVNPAFDTDNIIFDRSQDIPPNREAHMQIVYADLEGNFEAIGKVSTQRALLTVEIFVPQGSDQVLREQLAQNVHYVLRWLVLPDNGRKTRLSKRDFPDSVGGYSHTRVSVALTYDVRD